MQNAGKTKQLMPAAMATLKHGSDCGNVLTEIWVWERSFPLLAENLDIVASNTTRVQC